VLDADSVKDRKCVVCCDAPDPGEQGDEIVIKSVRMPFAEAATSMVSFEMMTMVPSEVNKDKVLNVMPPVWMDTTESPPGQLVGKIRDTESGEEEGTLEGPRLMVYYERRRCGRHVVILVGLAYSLIKSLPVQTLCKSLPFVLNYGYVATFHLCIAPSR
jgi:hypothetical protein